MRTGSTLQWTLAVAGLLALTACGGGGSDNGNGEPVSDAPGVEPTPITSIGKITAFGSVYVNGVKFDTSGASYDVDDMQAQSDAALAVGMIVKVTGSVNADGSTGTASAIKYDDEIEGPVAGLAADAADPERLIFTVLGVNVAADSRTHYSSEDDPDFGFDTIGNGDIVEVSGVYDGNVLFASFIEKQDGSDEDFEVKGTVSAYNGSDQFDLILRNGSALQIMLAAGATIPSAGIADGQYVEVEGTVPDPVNAPTSLLASRVELEDEDDLEAEDVEVELFGVLRKDSATGDWLIGDVVLAFTDNTEFEPEDLADRIEDGTAEGLTVEVEGTHSDGVLLVEEIEVEDGDLGFEAVVAAISVDDARNGTITLSFGGATGTVDVVVDNSTLFIGDSVSAPFDLTGIAAGDYLDVDARLADDGTIRATSLEREDGPGIEITGPVEFIDDVSVTIMGITFTVDSTTQFPEGVPSVDQYAEIEDENGDGLADVVELED